MGTGGTPRDHRFKPARWRNPVVVVPLGLVLLLLAFFVTAAAPSTSSPSPLQGDWSVTYGGPALVTITPEEGGDSFTMTAKTPLRVLGTKCDLPPGTLIATFAGTGSSFEGQHGLWYDDCSFASWARVTLTLDQSGTSLTENVSNTWTFQLRKTTCSPASVTGPLAPFAKDICDLVSTEAAIAAEAHSLIDLVSHFPGVTNLGRGHTWFPSNEVAPPSTISVDLTEGEGASIDSDLTFLENVTDEMSDEVAGILADATLKRLFPCSVHLTSHFKDILDEDIAAINNNRHALQTLEALKKSHGSKASSFAIVGYADRAIHHLIHKYQALSDYFKNLSECLNSSAVTVIVITASASVSFEADALSFDSAGKTSYIPLSGWLISYANTGFANPGWYSTVDPIALAVSLNKAYYPRGVPKKDRITTSIVWSLGLPGGGRLVLDNATDPTEIDCTHTREVARCTPGASVEITESDLLPSSPVQIGIFPIAHFSAASTRALTSTSASAPRPDRLRVVKTNQQGAFSFTATLPKSASPSYYYLFTLAHTPTGQTLLSSHPIRVLKPVCVAPSVTGMTLSDAKTTFSHTFCKFTVERVHASVLKGHIVSSNPPPGTRLKRGSLIHLRLSLGPRSTT